MKTRFGVVYRVLDDGWLRLWDLELARTHTLNRGGVELDDDIEGQIVKFTLESEDVLGQIDRVPLEQLPEKFQQIVKLRSSRVLKYWARDVMSGMGLGRGPDSTQTMTLDDVMRAWSRTLETEDEQTASTVGKPGMTLPSE